MSYTHPSQLPPPALASAGNAWCEQDKTFFLGVEFFNDAMPDIIFVPGEVSRRFVKVGQYADGKGYNYSYRPATMRVLAPGE